MNRPFKKKMAAFLLFFDFTGHIKYEIQKQSIRNWQKPSNVNVFDDESKVVIRSTDQRDKIKRDFVQ